VNAQTKAGGLAMSALTAGFAPSIHNTQPWCWRVSGTTLELRAMYSRQLRIADPTARFLVLSCGAALHHARVALAAEGWQVHVARMPDPGEPSLLASVTVAEPIKMTAAAVHLLQAARVRRTDRRPVSDTRVEPDQIVDLQRIADREHAHLHVLEPRGVSELAKAARRAQQIEQNDAAFANELAYWAGGERNDIGVPDVVIAEKPPQTTVPDRTYSNTGRLAIGPGRDREATYAILYGDNDENEAWLRAGEALSAVWLEAIQRNLTVLPLSSVIEVPETRHTLQRLLANRAEPFLALRIGVRPDDDGPAPTPRLPTSQTIEIRS
jgi:hypothetical protein